MENIFLKRKSFRFDNDEIVLFFNRLFLLILRSSVRMFDNDNDNDENLINLLRKNNISFSRKILEEIIEFLLRRILNEDLEESFIGIFNIYVN